MAERRRRKRDYYDVLGVKRDVEPDELKRVYRELARKYHPDINHEEGTEDRFKRVNEAYAVLSDPQSRARYDKYGFAGIGQDSGGGQGFGAVVDAVDDLVSDFLKRRRSKKRGSDLRYTLELTLEEAAFGCHKNIKVPRAGKVREFSVSIPAAVKDGTVKRLKGEGEVGDGGASPGDLNVILRVRPHPFFTREGDDIWCEVPVSFPQAALGDVIEVPTLRGKVNMKVPEGTQSGRVFRMRGKGVPKKESGSQAGDQLVRVLVETPTGMSDKQRSLLREFAKETGGVVSHPQSQSFLDSLKAFFRDG